MILVPMIKLSLPVLFMVLEQLPLWLIFLKQLNDLEHKVIDIFVTHLFRFSFLGGNQALKNDE